jgi:DNA mismatch repair ATPase MutS
LSLAYTDASTGEFFLKETTVSHMEDELARIAPREVVLDTSLREIWQSNLFPTADEGSGEPVVKLLNLLRVLGVHVSFADHVRPPIIEGLTQIAPTTSPPTPTTPSLEQTAIALLRHHLQYALRDEMPALNDPTRQSASSQMQIDAATLHALEVRHALRPGGMAPTDTYGAGRIGSPLSARGTLLSVLSKTMTPSGHRLLVRTLTAPSTDLDFINSRLDLVQSFVDRPYLREELKDMIRGVGDVMRIVQRFKGRRGDGRDAWEVGRWIRGVTRIIDRIRLELKLEPEYDAGASGHSRLEEFVHAFKPLETLAQTLEESIDEVAVLRGAVEEEGDEDGMEEAGEAMVAPPGRKEGETRKEEVERKRQEREDAMWWMRPRWVIVGPSENETDVFVQFLLDIASAA